MCVSNFSVQKNIKKPEGIMFSQRIFPVWRVIKEKQLWHTVTVVRESLVPMVCRISASMCSLGKIQEFTKINKYPRSAGFRSEDFVNPHAHK